MPPPGLEVNPAPGVDGNHKAFRGLKRRQEKAGEVGHREDIGFKDLTPQLPGRGSDLPRCHDSRGVHQHVKACYPSTCLRHLVLPGQVADEGGGVIELSDKLSYRGLVTSPHQDPVRGGELGRHSTADPASGSGHEGYRLIRHE